MYVQANPQKGRTAQEKEEITTNFKPGDHVLPKVERAIDLDEEDRRMVEEIREMSLREVGGRGTRSYERGVRHRNRSQDSAQEGVRHRRRRDGQNVGGASSSTADPRAQARQLGHQSSLRSLISPLDAEAAEIEEEILRQIVEDGLLDGIDLNNLDTTQEDELSERIADAYRRRHRTSRDPRTEDPRGSRVSNPRLVDQPTSRRQHGRTTGAVDQTSQILHPPVSRPHLLEAYPTTTQGNRRRTSSESRRQTSPVQGAPAERHEATRSATDLSIRPRTSESRDSRPSDLVDQGRRVTEPRSRRLSEGVRPHVQSTVISRQSDELPLIAPLRITPRRTTFDNPAPSHPVVSTTHNVATPTEIDQRVLPSNVGVPDTGSVRPPNSSSATSRTRPTLYTEPSVTCERCGKTNIEYELHENCSACQGGSYNICHRCYRLGRGCLHWYGFGRVAWRTFQQQASPGTPPPHILVGRRYQRPRQENIRAPTGSERKVMTTEDPTKRLESGAYCSNCFAYADDCFWKCGYCNDGEWGFCNRCINQGKCCTHPLLPVSHIPSNKAQNRVTQSTSASFTPITSPHIDQTFHPTSLVPFAQYRPLTISVNCKICTYPVQPSQTRFHCYECEDGDYDICTTCYSKLVAAGSISRDNSDKGWRRCLRGHRMIVVGFEDTSTGQQRVIVNDLVGGHALKDEEGSTASTKQEWSWQEGQEREQRTVSRQVAASLNSNSAFPAPLFQRYPPDGGVGMIVLALWTYLPQEGAANELDFPKGAEIREAEDINGDWFWGCYAGAKGLFPAPYVRLLDVARM
ncbi:hypothetical protein MMC19_006603 [Ptychographa xylographoides]|nr:hypothetical protein [Ptychographa xylographoides]